MKNSLDPLTAQSPNDSDDISTSDGSSRRKRLHPWTRLHSQYALMGGFAFDTSQAALPFLPEGRTQLTITSRALQKLATYEPDLIPDMSVEPIVERNKGDGFTKAIACMQALWFITQSIGRLIAGSAISLLELNTMLHAFCCLVAYIAWWNKPLDISTPTLIDISESSARNFVAWMVLKSDIGYRRELRSHEWLCASSEPILDTKYFVTTCCLLYEDDVEMQSTKKLTRQEQDDQIMQGFITGRNNRKPLYYTIDT